MPVTLSGILSSLEELPAILEHNARSPHKFDSVELPWDPSLDLEDLESRWGYWTFFEVTAAQAEEVASRLRGRTRWALKLRTGGLVAGAFPNCADIFRFVQVCHTHRKSYKFTAGLHHARPGSYPLTYAPEAERARMNGFLNLFLACAFHWQGGLAESSFQTLLQENDASALTWSPDRLTWNDRSLSRTEISNFRAMAARSFGSCSFTEPMEELQALGWLEA